VSIMFWQADFILYQHSIQSVFRFYSYCVHHAACLVAFEIVMSYKIHAFLQKKLYRYNLLLLEFVHRVTGIVF
jgi:hypothetical protein